MALASHRARHLSGGRSRVWVLRREKSPQAPPVWALRKDRRCALRAPTLVRSGGPVQGEQVRENVEGVLGPARTALHFNSDSVLS